MAKVAQAVGRDPAMTAKILRIANSAFYAQRRPSQNLRQALVIIGLNAALTLALSFSLVSSMRALRPVGHRLPPLLAPGPSGRDRRPRLRRVDQGRPCRRHFPCRAAAGHGGACARPRLARLLQQAARSPLSHADWIAYEIAATSAGSRCLYGDAAQVLESARAHLQGRRSAATTPQTLVGDHRRGPFRPLRRARQRSGRSRLARRIARASSPRWPSAPTSLLGMSHETLQLRSLRRILSLIPETEALYETSISTATMPRTCWPRRASCWRCATCTPCRKSAHLQATTSVLLTRTEEAEDSSRRDRTHRRAESRLARSHCSIANSPRRSCSAAT